MYSLNDVRMLRFGNLLYGIITCFSHLSGEIDSGNPMLFDRLRLILKNNGLITKWKGGKMGSKKMVILCRSTWSLILIIIALLKS